MKTEVQDKIDKMKELAKTSGATNNFTTQNKSRNTDSLSKVIRNSDEAIIFLAELDAAFAIANKR